jgi:hypothetical protein
MVTLYSSDIEKAGSRGHGSTPSGNARLQLLRRRPSSLCSFPLVLKSWLWRKVWVLYKMVKRAAEQSNSARNEGQKRVRLRNHRKRREGGVLA